MSSNEWNTWNIGDIGRIVTGKTPPTQNPNNFGDKYPFITPRDMLGQKQIHQTERYLSEEGKNTVKNCLLPANSVCVSCIGSDMGKVVMTTTDSVTNQQLNSVICKASFDPDFIYYALVNISDELRNVGHHSTAVPILNKTDFSNFEITAPGIVTQRSIGNILSALDEKIELNRQTNATLEAIAQAIFKEWFVDFNFPGATGTMVESELGIIPCGWRVGRLKDVCNVTMGQSPPGESYNETGEGIPFHQGRTDFGFRFPTQRVFTSDPKRFAKQFDTLVSVRAPVGDMNIATENCCIGRGLAAVIEKNGKYTFTYYFLRELTGKFKNFEDNGTVFGSINKTDFENMPCIVPNDGAINAFEDKCRSIDESILTTNNNPPPSPHIATRSCQN